MIVWDIFNLFIIQIYNERKILIISIKDLFSNKVFTSFISNILLFFDIKIYKDKNLLLFIKMEKYLWGGLLTTAAAASGSILYIAINDLYRMKTKKETVCSDLKTVRPSIFLNPGLILGASLGFTKAYLGYPVLNYFTNKTTKLIKNN